jgi:hypothetical protein
LPFSPRKGSFITFVPPPDNGTMGKETIAAILAGNHYPETGGYRGTNSIAIREAPTAASASSSARSLKGDSIASTMAPAPGL